MGAKFALYIEVLLLLLFVLEILSAEVKRVVFQANSLEYGETVQCYGRCLPDNKQFQTFNLTRCDGPKIRFDCNSGYGIKIKLTTLGRLSPDLDICRNTDTLECASDVTAKVQRTCNHARQCVIDIRKDQLRNKCGKVKFLSMDIQYVCEINPQTMLPTKAITTSASKHVVKKIPTDTIIKNTSLHDKNNSDRTTYQNTEIVLKSSKDNEMFWLITAFITISDSELIRKHKTTLALAILLSIVFGMVLMIIYFCLFLHYCRRKKNKRGIPLKESKLAIVPYPQTVEYNECVELVKPKMVEVINLNDYYPQQKTVSNDNIGYYNNNNGCHDNNGGYLYNNGGCHNNNKNNEKRKNDVYSSMSVARPVLKQIPEHKLVTYNHIDPNEDMPSSPNYVLVESPPPSTSKELLNPPPVNYNGDKEGIPYLVITCPTPTGSATNTLLKTKKILPHEKSESETENVYLKEPSLDDNIQDSEYEYVEIGQYHGSDGYSSSPQSCHPTRYHTTDNHIVPTKVKFAQMNRHATSNDETSQEDTLNRHVDSKRIRTRKYNQKDKPSVHKSKSLDGTKKRNYLSSNGNECLTRNPRRGRPHVMQRCEESVPHRSTSQRAIYSDNEVTRRRRRCEVEYKHVHDCNETETPRYMLYCSTCGISKESHLNCCSSLTSNCQSSYDEDCPDYHGSLPSRFNKRMKNKQFSVEESGYQSHDTGTDSLCSSTFSTDQEDSRMFAPASVSSSLHNGCRSNFYHTRVQTSRHSPKYILVRKHNASVPRRFRRHDYTNVDARPHHGHAYTSVEAHPYNSSLDDGSSRESVKIIRRIDKPNMSDGCLSGLHEDTNCNCNFKN